jgi:hypothetical protein
MRFKSSIAAFALALTLAGCSGYTPGLPDGGRGRVNCTDNHVTVPVTLLDKSGQPQPGAGVVAIWLSTGEEVVLETNGSGVALVPDKGPGVVRVQGQFNDLTTEVAELTFVGGECSTSVTPQSVTLQLK